eukprot:33431-Pyramimonas_sp.AAC.1
MAHIHILHGAVGQELDGSGLKITRSYHRQASIVRVVENESTVVTKPWPTQEPKRAKRARGSSMYVCIDI